jgi:hypothetical protein
MVELFWHFEEAHTEKQRVPKRKDNWGGGW